MILLDKFQCGSCRGPLTAGDVSQLVCRACGESIALIDGVIDFVRGRFDTILDAEHYDETHHIDDSRIDQNYIEMKWAAGDRWPASLGSVLEVGCGTGLFSRALITSGETQDLVLTDVSVAMLKSCHQRLEHDDLLARVPVSFATYSSQEDCLRDAVFDTCAGTSVLHHIPDVRGFLAEVFRILKPGGRAFFMEPNLRFNRALMHTLADVLALLFARDPEFSLDRQKLVNLLAEGRRGMLHQGDIRFLSSLEDKHMFVAEEFEQLGQELGYATALALPRGVHQNGAAIIGSLCAQLDIAPNVRQEVIELLPAYSSRYFSLLNRRDLSSGFLLWLEKGVGPHQHVFHDLPRDDDARAVSHHPPDVTGGMSPRWSFGLTANAGDDGIDLVLSGWCLVNADICWIRVTIGDESRDVPVWRPRPDVQKALNKDGFYAAWNAFCCGVEADIRFDGAKVPPEGLKVELEAIMFGGGVVKIKTPDYLELGKQSVIEA
jgi:ubiquinone/menaquinone biosynthesis C-methylase UbiE